MEASANVSDVEEPFHGTVKMINERFGFITPDHPLPPSQYTINDFSFHTPTNAVPFVKKGDRGMFVLKPVKGRDFAGDIAFENHTYDPEVESPYVVKRCHHICFKDKVSGQSRGFKTCLNSPQCCGAPCMRTCFDNCPRAVNRNIEEVTVHTTSTYTIHEMHGKLFGHVVRVVEDFGFIQPDQFLPQQFERGPVFFHSSNVVGAALTVSMRVCFQLKLNNEKPCAQWVYEIRNETGTEDIKKGRLNPHALCGVDKLLFGEVQSVNDRYGFVIPHGGLPEPFTAKKGIHFVAPTWTTIHKGQKAIFVIDSGSELSRPLTTNIVFVEDDYDQEIEHPYMCEECGNICFSMTDEADDGWLSRKCFWCLTKESGCRWVDGVMYGEVLSIDESYLFVKPDNPLPVPYRYKQNLVFSTPEHALRCVDTGDQVVFTVNVGSETRFSLGDIVFVNLSFNPGVTVPKKCDGCKFICFEDKSMAEEASRSGKVCRKSYSHLLYPNHVCTNKFCSSCGSCLEVATKHKTWTVPDVQEVLYGTVKMVNERFGFIRPDILLPPPHDTVKDVYFRTPDNMVPFIEKGHRAVFVLKAIEGRVFAGAIAFENQSFDPEIDSPYRCQRCCRICFRNKRTGKSRHDKNSPPCIIPCSAKGPTKVRKMVKNDRETRNVMVGKPKGMKGEKPKGVEEIRKAEEKKRLQKEKKEKKHAKAIREREEQEKEINDRKAMLAKKRTVGTAAGIAGLSLHGGELVVLRKRHTKSK